MLWMSPVIFTTFHILTASSVMASSVPRQMGMPRERIARNGMTPLPRRRLLIGLCATRLPASAMRSRSSSSTQMP